MASGSIFTFDADPQRVSSPWLGPDDAAARKSSTPALQQASSNDQPLEPVMLSDYGVTKLEAEPQEGPTEYKLHLLLRPRRRYKSMSTVPDSKRAAVAVKTEPRGLSATSTESRQIRLQQLTTQLLWRLQQSSPYHVLKPKDLVVPRLPDDAVDLRQALQVQRPVLGLEESRGALYEIGVSDDGTLVGLTQDEMDESIVTLRVMAATLGCRVDLLREVIVGECEWPETAELVGNGASVPPQTLRHGTLRVAEAFVTPDFGSRNGDPGSRNGLSRQDAAAESGIDKSESPSTSRSMTDQLRVTLTGPTTSGKSTLLGTLSTSTMDNGRGRSRLSLFKHRHEVVSGMTSSVAQELLGYKDDTIVNYSKTHVESWLDIHFESENGRLVFVSDSAGHPRFRRTILRGLKAHLELCLKLKTPLVVAITKLDLATKTSIQRVLGKVLTLIKEAGRIPKILQPAQNEPPSPSAISASDSAKVKGALGDLAQGGDLLKLVPIVLTSAVSGAGIGLMHALLKELPLPRVPTAHDFVGEALNPEQPSSVFHIDDTFSRPADFASITDNGSQSDLGIVVSGYLRFGHLSVGDTIVAGPFPSGDDDVKGRTPEERPSPGGGYGLSISHPSSAELARVAIRNAVAASTIKGEWHNARIVSIRNLRLGVRTLAAGQVGTIGILLDVPPPPAGSSEESLEAPRIRKGMVLAVPPQHMLKTGMSLQAASGLTAMFHDLNAASLMIGTLVNVYCGTVRAAARVLGLSTLRARDGLHKAVSATDEVEEIFAVDQDEDATRPTGVEVVLELLTSREWIELGSQVVILEGGRNDRSGLEGYVGNIVEIVD
ncbi:GTP-binding protein 2 like [Verticillium longisporum]|uniref:GTP-binding protein 2 like n=1 Tax=Verticillium longisporum TaxID=100787 RepID=A0A8I2ZII1_VERLO|nr:GTP-binding protein 2 like [Verticillium longisporum]